MKEHIVSVLLLFLAAVTIWAIAAGLHKKEYATPTAVFSHDDDTTPMISDEVIRLHILADSDNPQDQSIKLALRDVLLPYLNASTANASCKSEALTMLTNQCDFLTGIANETLKSLGVSYTATVSVTNLYFPIRIYGSQTYLSSDAVIFPPGYYDSVRIVLGKGNGHNWWCLAYPSLCFIDSTYEYIPKNSDLYKLKIGTVDTIALQKLFYGTEFPISLSEESTDVKNSEITVCFGSKLWELLHSLFSEIIK